MTFDLEPPRACPECGRRMVVQILPHGWWARCSRHGVIGPCAADAPEPVKGARRGR